MTELEKEAQGYVEMFKEYQFGILPEIRATECAIKHVEGLIKETKTIEGILEMSDIITTYIPSKIQDLTKIKEILTNRLT